MPSSSSSSSQPLLVQSRHQLTTHPTQKVLQTTRQIYKRSKRKTRDFLTSRAQHYGLLALISMDLLSIFTDIVINLYQCDKGPTNPIWQSVRDGLGIAGLVFSCLFMVELILSIWVFGLSYLTTPFHIFDALVILAGFIVDVLLHGVLEEVASLVVILRLWRFLKVVEEFSAGAEAEMSSLQERIVQLESENAMLNRKLSRGRTGDSEDGGERRSVSSSSSSSSR